MSLQSWIRRLLNRLPTAKPPPWINTKAGFCMGTLLPVGEKSSSCKSIVATGNAVGLVVKTIPECC